MSEASEEKPHRPIRSYVLRQGRVTEAQQRAFDQLWPRYGLTLDEGQLDLAGIFGNPNPVTLEIGFGNGESLAEMARQAPEQNFLGVEVHSPGVGHLMIKLDEYECSNVRILQTDAMELLRHHLPTSCLSRVQLYFPDPWPKKRHHKRRIVNPEYTDLLRKTLVPGGVFTYGHRLEELCRADDGGAHCPSRFYQSGRQGEFLSPT